MPTDITENNPDLAGFDIANMKELGAHQDASGGGIQQLAWEMRNLRETQERIDRLRAFINKHQMTLARLSWDVDVDALPPVKREDILFVPEIQLCHYAYDKKRVTAQDIIKLWPDAEWSRSKPRHLLDDDRTRDYTAEIDGVIVRITDAEKKPKPVVIDNFPPCGRLRGDKEFPV